MPVLESPKNTIDPATIASAIEQAAASLVHLRDESRGTPGDSRRLAGEATTVGDPDFRGPGDTAT
jgi:hypothetical protein